MIPVGIKAGQTITADYFRNLDKWTTLAQKVAGQPYLVYGGAEEQRRSNVHILSWRHLDELIKHL